MLTVKEVSLYNSFLLGSISETNFCLFQPEDDRSLGHLTRVTIATGPHTCILMGALSPSQDPSQIISVFTLQPLSSS